MSGNVDSTDRIPGGDGSPVEKKKTSLTIMHYTCALEGKGLKALFAIA